jgi:nucleotide-binding universal stress UspA family protein
MKTIIVPTDFSSISENACLYAANMATDIKAELVLFHTMELPIAVAEYPVTEDVFDETGIEKELDALKNKLHSATNNNINIKTRNIVGSAEYEIKKLCETTKPFAVVMGTHSSSVLDRFFLGSITVYIAKHLQFPVINVPHNAVYKSIKKIALASDLKDVYHLPAHEIESFVKLFNAEFEVFFVGKNAKDVDRNTLASLTLDHRLVSLNPQFHLVEGDDITHSVTTIAKEHNVDLLIIVPKKHGPFHKSQSRDFIFYSDVPVMAIHENDLNNNLNQFNKFYAQNFAGK